MADAAVDPVRALLEHVLNIQIIGVRRERHLESGRQRDAKIDLVNGGSRYALLLESKSNRALRIARSAVCLLESCIARLRQSEHQGVTRQFIPMLVSP